MFLSGAIVRSEGGLGVLFSWSGIAEIDDDDGGVEGVTLRCDSSVGPLWFAMFDVSN